MSSNEDSATDDESVEEFGGGRSQMRCNDNRSNRTLQPASPKDKAEQPQDMNAPNYTTATVYDEALAESKNEEPFNETVNGENAESSNFTNNKLNVSDDQTVEPFGGGCSRFMGKSSSRNQHAASVFKGGLTNSFPQPKLAKSGEEQINPSDDETVEQFGGGRSQSKDKGSNHNHHTVYPGAVEDSIFEVQKVADSSKRQVSRPCIKPSAFHDHPSILSTQLPFPGNYGYRGITNADYCFPTNVKIFRLDINEIGAIAHYVDGNKRSFVFSQLARVISLGTASSWFIFAAKNETVCNKLASEKSITEVIQAFRSQINEVVFRGVVTAGLIRMFIPGNKNILAFSMLDVQICSATARDSLGYDTLRAIYGMIGPETKNIVIDLRSTKIASFNLAVEYMHTHFYNRAFDRIEIAASKSCNRVKLADCIHMIGNLLLPTGTATIVVHEYYRDFIVGLNENGVFATGLSITYSMKGSEIDIQWFHEYRKELDGKTIYFYLAMKDYDDRVGYEESCYNFANMSI